MIKILEKDFPRKYNWDEIYLVIVALVKLDFNIKRIIRIKVVIQIKSFKS